MICLRDVQFRTPVVLLIVVEWLWVAVLLTVVEGLRVLAVALIVVEGLWVLVVIGWLWMVPLLLLPFFMEES